MKKQIFLSILSCLLVVSFTVSEVFGLDRRRDQFGNDFSYYIYPIASRYQDLELLQAPGSPF